MNKPIIKNQRSTPIELAALDLADLDKKRGTPGETPHLDAALDQARANMRIVDIRQLDVEIALLQMEDKELRER